PQTRIEKLKETEKQPGAPEAKNAGVPGGPPPPPLGAGGPDTGAPFGVIGSGSARDQPRHRLRHFGEVGGAMFAAGGAELISWEKEGAIRVWDLQTGAKKKQYLIGFKGDKLTAPLDRVAPLAVNRWLILAGGRAQVWDSAKDVRSPAL